ncbi:hypothetical protein D3C71_1644380 [compost metagenome]
MMPRRIDSAGNNEVDSVPSRIRMIGSTIRLTIIPKPGGGAGGNFETMLLVASSRPMCDAATAARSVLLSLPLDQAARSSLVTCGP